MRERKSVNVPGQGNEVARRKGSSVSNWKGRVFILNERRLSMGKNTALHAGKERCKALIGSIHIVYCQEKRKHRFIRERNMLSSKQRVVKENWIPLSCVV